MVRVVRPRSTQSSPDGSTIQVRIIVADTKTDSSSTPLSDDPANPTTGGLSAKPNTASHPAGAEPGLDTLFHRTDLHFCCASKMPTASVAREPDVTRASKDLGFCFRLVGGRQRGPQFPPSWGCVSVHSRDRLWASAISSPVIRCSTIILSQRAREFPWAAERLYHI